jgi:hypothetical protein
MKKQLLFLSCAISTFTIIACDTASVKYKEPISPPAATMANPPMTPPAKDQDAGNGNRDNSRDSKKTGSTDSTTTKPVNKCDLVAKPGLLTLGGMMADTISSDKYTYQLTPGLNCEGKKVTLMQSEHVARREMVIKKDYDVSLSSLEAFGVGNLGCSRSQVEQVVNLNNKTVKMIQLNQNLSVVENFDVVMICGAHDLSNKSLDVSASKILFLDAKINSKSESTTLLSFNAREIYFYGCNDIIAIGNTDLTLNAKTKQCNYGYLNVNLVGNGAGPAASKCQNAKAESKINEEPKTTQEFKPESEANLMQ